jgi:hypothetical protein
VHQIDFSLLKYQTVICTALCAYVGRVLTNWNEWIPGIVKRITNGYYAYSCTKESTVLRRKQ